MKTFAKQTFFAHSAQILSGLCLIHCLATPFVVVLLPSFAHFFGDELELWITLAVVPIAFAGFIPTWLKHRNSFIGAKFVVGLSLLVIGGTYFHVSHETVAAAAVEASIFAGLLTSKMFFSLAGASLLAYTMYRNNKHVHICHNPHHAH